MIVPVRATYRVQLHAGFAFDDAVGVLDRLDRLGVSHLYTSPVLEATPGSTHGYDVTDHTRVRDALGGADGLVRLVDALRTRRMGWVVDLVPNHVSVAVPRANPRWWDLLRHGSGSASAGWFDVDWDAGAGRVVLPVLGAPLDEEVERGTIEVRDADEGLVIGYHGYEVPTRPGSVTADDVGATGDRLREILAAQHHRLSHWRLGERNYRVFFDIDSLAAIRMEVSEVFDEAHALLRSWVDDDLVDGIRIDHVDGLADPGGYLDALRDVVGPERPIWIEKILMPDEVLPAAWPVDGTTGYDFARLTTAVAVDPPASATFDELWAARGDDRPYEAVETDAKREAVTGSLAPELRRVVAEAAGAGLPAHRDAVAELAVAFPAYRTYGTGTDPLGPEDAGRLDAAVRGAVAARPDLQATVASLGDALRAPADPATAGFRTRFQQLTSAAMAKGAEDTAFYRYHRLVALNEVGGDPGRFGATPAELHEHNRVAGERWPRTMLAASTHDTKRSADVRARLAAASQHPGAWAATFEQWRSAAASGRPGVLDDATEYLCWQTLVGAWPISAERLRAYLVKAAREGGVHTSWTDVADDYEAGLVSFVDHVVADDAVRSIIERFVADLEPVGRAARLAEVVLRLTCPGIPDTYQGDEDWTFDLVDPDNRRPVDHERLARRMAVAAEVADVDELFAGPDRLDKLWVTHRLLVRRSEQPERLVSGTPCEPIDVTGSQNGVVAFRRGDGVVAVDARPGSDPADVAVRLPPGEWRDLLRRDHHVRGGRAVPVDELWQGVRVAVFVRQTGGQVASDG